MIFICLFGVPHPYLSSYSHQNFSGDPPLPYTLAIWLGRSTFTSNSRESHMIHPWPIWTLNSCGCPLLVQEQHVIYVRLLGFNSRIFIGTAEKRLPLFWNELKDGMESWEVSWQNYGRAFMRTEHMQGKTALKWRVKWSFGYIIWAPGSRSVWCILSPGLFSYVSQSLPSPILLKISLS